MQIASTICLSAYSAESVVVSLVVHSVDSVLVERVVVVCSDSVVVVIIFDSTSSFEDEETESFPQLAVMDKIADNRSDIPIPFVILLLKNICYPLSNADIKSEAVLL